MRNLSDEASPSTAGGEWDESFVISSSMGDFSYVSKLDNSVRSWSFCNFSQKFEQNSVFFAVFYGIFLKKA